VALAVDGAAPPAKINRAKNAKVAVFCPTGGEQTKKNKKNTKFPPPRSLLPVASLVLLRHALATRTAFDQSLSLLLRPVADSALFVQQHLEALAAQLGVRNVSLNKLFRAPAKGDERTCSCFLLVT
jgi:hypothetical protein